MALTPSQRHTREWPLFVLSLALVCALCIPLKQWLAERVDVSAQLLGSEISNPKSESSDLHESSNLRSEISNVKSEISDL